MTPIRVLVAVILMAVFSNATFANEALSPSSIDEMRAAAESIFEQTENADGVFEINDQGALLHLQSGLTCASMGKKAILTNVVVLDELGRDVACNYDVPDTPTRITIYATQHNGEDIQGQIDQTIAIVRQQIEANLVDGPLTMGVDDTKELIPLAAKLNYVHPPGNKVSTSIWINSVNGWMVKIRATYPTDEEQAMKAELLSGVFWIHGALEVMNHHPN